MSESERQDEQQPWYKRVIGAGDDKHSPSQTPAERAHQDDPSSPVPPEEDLQGPQSAWRKAHTPPKEMEQSEHQQQEQAEALRQHRQELLDAERERLDALGLEVQPVEVGEGNVPGGSPRRQEEYPSTQGATAPEPVGAKEHRPGEFEQPAREEYVAENGERSRPYGDAA